MAKTIIFGTGYVGAVSAACRVQNGHERVGIPTLAAIDAPDHFRQASPVASQPTSLLESDAVTSALPTTRTFYASAGKRVLDVVIAAVMLVLLSPTILFLGLLVAACDGHPFYRHRRIGRGGKPFYCLKVRTMALDSADRLELLLAADPEAAREWRETRKLRNDPRISPIGHFLRKTSLDELPQLWNVLHGDMSLVGPRPVVAEELERYQQAQAAYLSVRPGLTGAWQIAPLRNERSYAQRVALDSDYAASVTFRRDVLILFGTVCWAMSPNGL